MKFYALFLIAIALSLDAFGVSLSVGLNRMATRKYKILCILSFGFFQFLFSILGAYAGFLFNTYIVSVPKVIGGIVIMLVGILMIKEGLENKEECAIVKPGMWILLGISVSIDAMVVGFTALNNLVSGYDILKDTLFIGLITIINCIFAFGIAKYLRKIQIIGKYADYIGGIILVIFGLKMIFF